MVLAAASMGVDASSGVSWLTGPGLCGVAGSFINGETEASGVSTAAATDEDASEEDGVSNGTAASSGEEEEEASESEPSTSTIRQPEPGRAPHKARSVMSTTSAVGAALTEMKKRAKKSVMTTRVNLEFIFGGLF